MKKARYGGTPIPMPDIPGGIAGLYKFAAQVRRSIQTLRDRPVLYSTSASTRESTHPWKARANGDNTVNINAGKILYWVTSTSGTFPNAPFNCEYIEYAGGDVTVTGAGTIYVTIPAADFTEVSNDGALLISQVFRPTIAGTLTVSQDPAYTGDNLYIPIAEVDLADSVASVTDQVLNYNPIIQLGFSYNDSP